MTGRRSTDIMYPDFRHASRISLGTWTTIVILIVAVAGWGFSTRASTATNEKQDVKIEELRKEKASKEDLEKSMKAVEKSIDLLRDDIREERKLHHGGK